MKAVPFCSILFFLFYSATSFSQSAAKAEQGKPFVLGVIDEIQSVELAEKRILNIYLPDGYNANDTAKYPVVYLLDGSADEDFIHVTGLYQFSSFDWVHRVPKSIIVGIANTDRKRDFTYPTSFAADVKRYPSSGHSEKFINFIEKELQPYISSEYKTNSSKTIIGESLGGLLATEILLKHPTLFNRYIIISPSIWWDNGSLLNFKSSVLQKNFTQPTDIYIGAGKDGRTPGDAMRIQEDDAKLLAEKLKASESKSLNVHFDYLPDEDHATVAHQALLNALKLFSGEKK